MLVIHSKYIKECLITAMTQVQSVLRAAYSDIKQTENALITCMSSDVT